MRSAQVDHGQTWSIPGGGHDDAEKTAKESDPRLLTPGTFKFFVEIESHNPENLKYLPPTPRSPP